MSGVNGQGPAQAEAQAQAQAQAEAQAQAQAEAQAAQAAEGIAYEPPLPEPLDEQDINCLNSYLERNDLDEWEQRDLANLLREKARYDWQMALWRVWMGLDRYPVYANNDANDDENENNE
jgi:hypothetical protein